MKTKTISKTIVAISIIVLAFTAFFAVCFAPQAANVAFADGIEELSYRGASGLVTTTDTFSYSTKTTESYFINSSVPAYYDTANRNYTCAPVAGANLIGFYDRYFPNLVSDIATGYARGTRYSYYVMERYETQLQSLINDLASRMGTDSSGTTLNEFETGMTSYVASKNLNITYIDVTAAQTNALDLENAIAQLENGNPIAFFTSGINFTTFTDTGSSVIMTIKSSSDNHVFVAYGYQKVIYYDASGNIVRECISFQASSGEDGLTGYYVLNLNGNINAAKAVHLE